MSGYMLAVRRYSDPPWAIGKAQFVEDWYDFLDAQGEMSVDEYEEAERVGTEVFTTLASYTQGDEVWRGSPPMN